VIIDTPLVGREVHTPRARTRRLRPRNRLKAEEAPSLRNPATSGNKRNNDVISDAYANRDQVPHA
jgi:hypothetical protein